MEKNPKNSSTVFKVGAIALTFLIIGYQSALFVHKAAVLRIESIRDHPDTVYVIDESVARDLLTPSEANDSPVVEYRLREADNSLAIRKNAEHSPKVERVRERTRRVESFRFDPNTVGETDLERLGFSEKQARSIVAYREKGGRFRRKEDFARSYVVADSVYRRLEQYIDIPRLDINKADSAAFDSLPGVGGWFAEKMVSYREELGGYSCTEQLMEIYRFDREKYDALSDLVWCSEPEKPFALWSLPVEELRKHPHIRSYQTAKSVVTYRENMPKSEWTVEGLAKAGVLTEKQAAGLSLCRLADPVD